MAYQRLPELDDRRNNETSLEFGIRALLFIMAHGFTSTMSTDALEQALHASIYAVTPHDLQASAVMLISEAKMEIFNALSRRQHEAELLSASERRSRLVALASQAASMRPMPGLDDLTGGGGSRVPVIPRPPTLPSAGTSLAPSFSARRLA